MIVEVQKKIGETPNELIENFKRERDITEKVAFAGRLDPMASGKMILLTGVDCKKISEFCGYKKLYSFKCIKGIKTDTGDILGIPRISKSNDINDLKPNKFYQEYPAYSSKCVDGKPLWKWAREEELDHITIPGKMVEIYNVLVNDTISISSDDLFIEIKDKINQLSEKNRDNFRVDIILNTWKQLLESLDHNIEVESYILFVSSGTYIRGICGWINGTAMDIHRMEIVA
jgi:tRNA U55 pseudouridine synthase TruB